LWQVAAGRLRGLPLRTNHGIKAIQSESSFGARHEMLSEQQKQELEKWGPDLVRAHVAGFPVGPGDIHGFKCGPITRSDITDWLAIKNSEEQKRQASILWWAKLAAVASVVSVIVGIAAIFFQK
jgi:hypothetical protein